MLISTFQGYITLKTTTPSEHFYAHPNMYQESIAPSIAAPSEMSSLPLYAYPKSTGTSIYNYPATGSNDYASIPASSQYQPLYEGHGHVYQGTVPTYTRPTHEGETGSEMSYAAPMYASPIAQVYSPIYGMELNRNDTSELTKGPESVATYATVSKLKDKGRNTGVQMRQKNVENILLGVDSLVDFRQEPLLRTKTTLKQPMLQVSA